MNFALDVLHGLDVLVYFDYDFGRNDEGSSSAKA